MLDYNPLPDLNIITNRENSNPSETQVQYYIHLKYYFWMSPTVRRTLIIILKWFLDLIFWAS